MLGMSSERGVRGWFGKCEAAEAVDVGERARSAHDLAAVGVVPERRVALDRGEGAAGARALDDSDVVGRPTVPVVDREVAGARSGAAEPSAGRTEPRLGGRDV